MITWQAFQHLAVEVMSRHFGVTLSEKNPKDFPKRFDLVSDDEQTVGDAKYLTLVAGKKTPPAKLMEITGHVWLLERVPARRRFLVFGHQKDVAQLWIKKYGSLLKDVEFYFLADDGNLELLHPVQNTPEARRVP